MIHQYMGVVIAIDPFQLVYLYKSSILELWTIDPKFCVLACKALQQKPGISSKKTRDSWKFGGFSVHSGEDLKGFGFQKSESSTGSQACRGGIARHPTGGGRPGGRRIFRSRNAAGHHGGEHRGAHGEANATLVSRYVAGQLDHQKILLKMKIIQKRTSFKEGNFGYFGLLSINHLIYLALDLRFSGFE